MQQSTLYTILHSGFQIAYLLTSSFFQYIINLCTIFNIVVRDDTIRTIAPIHRCRLNINRLLRAVGGTNFDISLSTLNGYMLEKRRVEIVNILSGIREKAHRRE